MRLIAILGPTASGKSALAYELARRGNFEIIGADAFQMYRGMDVLSAAPSVQERAEFPHHLVGFLNPNESYSVAQYQVDARKAIEEAKERFAQGNLIAAKDYHGAARLREKTPEEVAREKDRAITV